MKVLVDTNILIDYSKGYGDNLGRLFELQKKGVVILFVNPIIIAEYFTDKQLIGKTEFEKAKEFLSLFQSFPITDKIGIVAGQFLRERTVGFVADSCIAAMCIVEAMQLATRNKKDFSKVQDLQFYPL